MKKIVAVLAFLSTLFTIQAQGIDSLLKKIEAGERMDTLISFDNKDKLEYIPLVIIKGKNTDPVFTIVAGVHGYEYPPIIAVQELMKEIKTDRLQGTLIILPVANTASFYRRSPFVNPIDGKNLNTVFPGSAGGSITDKIAYWIAREIIPLSDVFLDIHGGDANEDLLPFICYYNNQDEPWQTEQARLLSDASGMEYIVSYPYTISKTEPAKYAFKQAVQSGIVALSIEAGKLGTVQTENVALIKNALYNILNYSGMYTSGKTSAEPNKKRLHNQSYIRVPGKGMFYSSIKSGDSIAKGQNMGYITDDFGNILHHISAPVSGIVLYKVGTPPVNAGETLFCIGY